MKELENSCSQTRFEIENSAKNGHDWSHHSLSRYDENYNHYNRPDLSIHDYNKLIELLSNRYTTLKFEIKDNKLHIRWL